MTETEWLTCEDPAVMFNDIGQAVSDRMLRLFACVCCYRIWHLIPEAERIVVKAVERFAEGHMSEEEMFKAAGIDPNFPGNLIRVDYASRAAMEAAAPRAWFSVKRSRAFAVDAVRIADSPAAAAAERLVQSQFLRCLFGNPFRDVVVDPTWWTWNDRCIERIAQAIYDERAFDRMPILADALEDAGCDNADILNHCRNGGEHMRGCWVVDLLLGKS